MDDRTLSEPNGRHAYLVIAHKDDMTLRTLLHLLDDARNDIFLHMDAKNENWDKEGCLSTVKQAGCFAIPRISVAWGGYTLIECALNLLEASTKQGHYNFYHLLSGQDLPIKGQDEIHSFFDAHLGTEFVRYAEKPIDCTQRVYGHRLWNKYGRYRTQRVLAHLDELWSMAEHVVSHPKYDWEFQKGDNWFSIGDSFARYVVSQRKKVAEVFRNSWACDEVFLHTLLWNSPYKDKVYRQNGEYGCDAIQRLIDWKRGTPYCYRYSDLEELKSSPLLFARKFDCEIDPQIIEAIADLVENK